MGNTAIASAVLGALVPLVTALLTKAQATVRTKATLSTVLVWLGGTAVALASKDGAFDAHTTAETVVTAFVTYLAGYQGFWKPLGVIGGTSPGVVDRATAGFGIGKRAV